MTRSERETFSRKIAAGPAGTEAQTPARRPPSRACRRSYRTLAMSALFTIRVKGDCFPPHTAPRRFSSTSGVSISHAAKAPGMTRPAATIASCSWRRPRYGTYS